MAPWPDMSPNKLVVDVILTVQHVYCKIKRDIETSGKLTLFFLQFIIQFDISVRLNFYLNCYGVDFERAVACFTVYVCKLQ